MTTPLEIIKKKRAEAVHRIIEQEGYLNTRVYVGAATCEIAAGSEEVMEVFQAAIQKGEIKNVFLSQKGCTGKCNFEPMVEIIETGKLPVKYYTVNAEKAQQIIERHLKHGEVITEWIIQ